MPVAPRLHTALHHRSQDAFQVPQHRHQHHELVLVLRGNLMVSCVGLRLPGAAGSLHVFPAGISHNQDCRGSWHTICLLFHGEDELVSSGPRAIETGEDTLLQSWFEQLSAIARNANDQDQATCDSLLATVLLRIHRLRHEHDDQSAQPPALTEALAVIARQLDRDLDVAALARQVGLSRSHLGELFRRHVGTAPKRHHASLRMARAKAMMANPYTSVSTIARELGFRDLNWFVRRFGAQNGLPPGRWRAQVDEASVLLLAGRRRVAQPRGD